MIHTTHADGYAATRIMLAETTATQAAWNKLATKQRGRHNRDLFIAKNPSIFDADQTDTDKHTALARDGIHYPLYQAFIRNDREPLSRSRNQISDLCKMVRTPLLYLSRSQFLQFGLAAIIHPATSLDSLGRRTVSLTRMGRRLHVALSQRPELRCEIEARADGNLKVIRELLRGMVVGADKDAVWEYFEDLIQRVTFYSY
jgi:hypothetical protein